MINIILNNEPREAGEATPTADSIDQSAPYIRVDVQYAGLLIMLLVKLITFNLRNGPNGKMKQLSLDSCPRMAYTNFKYRLMFDEK